MHIINIQNNNHNVMVSYPPGLIHILKQFFASAEQRNEQLKLLIEEIKKEKAGSQNHSLLLQLLHHSEETEVDIELVKKLLP